MTESYRLIHGEMPVAWAEGRNAAAEIMHYVDVYGQDGPVEVQQKVNGCWVSLFKLGDIQ